MPLKTNNNILLGSILILFKDTFNKDTILQLVKKSVKRVGLAFPFAKNCLVKCITCKIILNNYGIHCKIILSMLNHKERNIKAHAYLVIDNTYYWYKLKNHVDLYSF